MTAYRTNDVVNCAARDEEREEGLVSDDAGAVHFYDEVIAYDAYFPRLHEFDGTLVAAAVHTDADGVSVFESAFAGNIFHIEWNAGEVGSGGRRVVARCH